jgi:D-arginine utilization repressor
MSSELNLYKTIAEGIGLLLSPYAEVIIHDFKTKCIRFIYNNLSKRKIGDESLLDEMETLSASQDVFSPYFKINWDGRKMKSVSIVLKNRAEKPIGLLCINIDVSKWEQMHCFILDFIESKIEKPDFLFKNDWREKINVYVTSYLTDHGLCFESLDRKDKKKLLLELMKEGAFNTKNAASYIADVLKISRATVYNYLKEKP